MIVRRLKAVIDSLGGALRAGGLFVFDVNTVQCLARDWGNQIEEERCGTATLVHVYRYSLRSRIGMLELVCIRKADGQIEKFGEIHRERGFTRQEIAVALEHAALRILEEASFPDPSPARDSASRLIYVAAKPAAAPE